ncbi:MAG: S-layer homology domain-containing protein [Candidatus Microthrix subdominans]
MSVGNITNATSITAYFNSNCALLADGTVKCWGQNSFGQLGNGTTTRSSTPVSVSNLTGATSIAGGQYSVCATVGIGAKCWGRNNSGQLGNGTTNDASTPVSVMGITGVADLAVGNGHGCARSTGGAVACWGANSSGQLGNGTTTDSLVAQVIPGLSGVSTIAAGGSETCAETSTLLCWGANHFGQLGHGDTVSSSKPKLVLAGLCEAATDPGFVDVPAYAYYEKAVAWLAAMGISAGTTPGNFSPDTVVRRRDMAVFIHRAFDEPTPQGTNPFSDVPNNAYYTDAAVWLAERGISVGTALGKFSPNDPVARRDMAVFLHRATGSLAAPPHSFIDVAANAYYGNAVSWLAHTGISGGTTPGRYSPNTNVARRDMAVFLNRRGCGA